MARLPIQFRSPNPNMAPHAPRSPGTSVDVQPSPFSSRPNPSSALPRCSTWVDAVYPRATYPRMGESECWPRGAVCCCDFGTSCWFGASGCRYVYGLCGGVELGFIYQRRRGGWGETAVQGLYFAWLECSCWRENGEGVWELYLAGMQM